MAISVEAGFQQREANRVQVFSSIWDREINDVFADVAKYYDRANVIASLGMLGVWLRGFVSTIDVKPGDKVLDVCAGTNVMGIALMKKEPGLDVQAMDRSQEMQSVGKMRAEKLGFQINSDIGDVHKLPYPDNHFDVVTLQYASRHLGILEVSKEINRVLKPGGHYYHCDMLRPSNPTVEKAYYTYLKGCLDIVSWLFGSKSAALNCRAYFIEAIKLFYSADEFSDLLRSSGFTNVSSTEVFGGMVAYHKAMKP